ncbi:MAG: hypothetical protein WKF34_10965 [Pyrinomonadaceae bacterium]
MLMYALIGLCLVLLGIAGLQFMYLFHIERLYKQRRTHMHKLERRCSTLSKRLEDAELYISEREASVETVRQEDSWADVIEER